MSKAIYEAVGYLLKEARQEIDAQVSEQRGCLDRLSDAFDEALKELSGEIETAKSSLPELAAAVSDEVQRSRLGLEEFQTSLESRVFESLSDQLRELKAQIQAMEAPKGEKGEPGEPGVPGETGEKGEPGVPGLDRPIADVFPSRPGLAVERGAVVSYAGGLFQSVRKSVGNPGEDPGSYRVILNGIDSATEHDDFVKRQHITSIRLSDGSVHEVRRSMSPMPMDHLPDGAELRSGDWQIVDGVLKTYLGDGLYSVVPVRGNRGRKGERGDPGEAAPTVKSAEMVGGELLLTLSDDSTVPVLGFSCAIQSAVVDVIGGADAFDD